jgi:L-alanine-DL-glutamate epimerase-like enolase superfamily enzyme
MRIVSAEVFHLRLALPEAVADALTDVTHWDVIALRLDSDEGISGWGYNCTLAEGSGAVKALLEQDLAPKLIGQDPAEVARLWKEIYLDRHFTGITGVAVMGIAAPEIALQDILAKAKGQPLWQVLGGRDATRIPAYSTDGGWLGFSDAELVANARAVKAAGFHGFKMKVGLPDLDADCRRLAAVRAAVGGDYPVMIDANGRWDLAEARDAARAFAPYRPYWLEEPLHPFDVPAHAALARATEIPILAGETLYDIRMFRDFMAAGALGLAQPDVLKLGGIGTWMAVADLARSHGLEVVPAGFNLMQIDAHLMAAIPHGLMMEHIPWLGPIFERPVRVEHGFALVPQEPGIGTDIRGDAIERYGVAKPSFVGA